MQFIYGRHPLALGKAARPYLSRSRILVAEKIPNPDYDRPHRAFVIRADGLVDRDVEVVPRLPQRYSVIQLRSSAL